MSLAVWLRTGRGERGFSIDDVARITKIQPRILERLEAGTLDGLPADVFVRGFVRSYAKCCGLEEAEALRRYAAATQETRPSTAHYPAQRASEPGHERAVSPAARAMVDLMTTTPAPVEATPPVETDASVPVEPSTASQSAQPATSKKKNRKGKRARRAAKRLATGTPAAPMPVVTAPAEIAAEVEALEAPAVVDAAPEPASIEPIAAEPVACEREPVDHLDPLVACEREPVDHLDPLVAPPADAAVDVVVTETWQPQFPKAPPAASVPWRRPARATATAVPSVPSLVIDDADPESAAQVLEDREAAKSVLTNAQRRSFLPPILLDREDRGARQGGLTLAVIILLIAATLTLSYLMRRPSASGDGVTQATHETQLIG